MDDRDLGYQFELRHTTEIASSNDIRSDPCNVCCFSLRKSTSNYRLKHVVGSGRSAAQMSLRHVADFESGPRQQCLRLVQHPLAVLQRAGRMIGDHEVAVAHRRHQVERGQIFRHVFRRLGDPRRLFRIDMVVAQQKTVILHHRAAAGRGDQDRVDPFALDRTRPDVDVAPHKIERFALAAEMMGQRSAAALALRHHDFDAMAVEQSDRGLVDRRRQHLVDAARQDRDPAFALADRREAPFASNLRPSRRRGGDEARQGRKRPQSQQREQRSKPSCRPCQP